MNATNSSNASAADNPGFHLNLVARLLTRFFDRRLAPLDVNVAYLPVLGALRVASPRSQGELAHLGQIGQPAMAQMLARMVKEGLLTRTADVHDGRKAQFALSAHGIARMASLRTVLSEGNSAVFDVLTGAELATFMASLHKIEQRLKTLTDAAPES